MLEGGLNPKPFDCGNMEKCTGPYLTLASPARLEPTQGLLCTWLAFGIL